MHAVRQDVLARNMPLFLRDLARAQGRSPVLLLAAGRNTVMLSLVEYQAWVRDYHVALSYSASINAADRQARESGADAVLQFRPSREPSVERTVSTDRS